MLLRAVSTALLAAAVALVLAAPAPAASFKRCGKVSLGYTSAKISGQGMPCTAAREVFKAWRSVVRRANPDGGPAPSRTSVGPFSCRFGGTDLTLKLDCTGADGKQAVRARWGG